MRTCLSSAGKVAEACALSLSVILLPTTLGIAPLSGSLGPSKWMKRNPRKQAMLFHGEEVSGCTVGTVTTKTWRQMGHWDSLGLVLHIIRSTLQGQQSKDRLFFLKVWAEFHLTFRP